MGSAGPRRIDRTAEIQTLAHQYGEPIRDTIKIPQARASLGPAGFPLSSRRTAEVVLVIPRPGGRVLVHTKNFYPAGVWRLPTGGLHPGEGIEEAIRREAEEETGNGLRPVRFLFFLQFRWEGSNKEFDSYGFLTGEAPEKIESRDPREQIRGFRDATRHEVEGIAVRLESLSGRWRSWGRFRAGPHRLLLRRWPPSGSLQDIPPPDRT